jgi:hypothetical protein
VFLSVVHVPSSSPSSQAVRKSLLHVLLIARFCSKGPIRTLCFKPWKPFMPPKRRPFRRCSSCYVKMSLDEAMTRGFCSSLLIALSLSTSISLDCSTFHNFPVFISSSFLLPSATRSRSPPPYVRRPSLPETSSFDSPILFSVLPFLAFSLPVSSFLSSPQSVS